MFYFVRTPAFEWIQSLGKWAGALTLTAAIGLYFGQNKLIYPANFPEGSRTKVDKPSQFGMKEFDDLKLVAPDGTVIHAYLILQGAQDGKSDDEAPKRPTLLLLHANAGNMGHRLPIAKVFYRMLRLNVMLVSYRGYGLSQGSPNEKGIKLDAQTALDHILSHPLLEKTKIILYGQSIGGAVAIHLAHQNQQRIHAVVVENTFWALKDVAAHVMSFLTPFLFLCNQYWESSRLITKFRKDLPFLFISGLQDDLVPPAHMSQLYEECSSQVKVFKEFEEGTHNDTVMQIGYFEYIAHFLRKYVMSPEEASVKAYDGVDQEKFAANIEEELAAGGAEAGSFVPGSTHND